MIRMLHSAHVAAMIVAVCAALAWAAEAARAGDAGGRVPMPRIPKALGEHCVADTGFMRRNHMTLLRHERDDTLHLGVRRAEFALPRCLACHAVTGADGTPVSYADPRHFCRTCHAYAAVSVDCFECHSSLPERSEQTASSVAGGADTAMLTKFLRDSAR